MKLRIVLLLILSVLLLARAAPNRTQAPIVFTHIIIDVTGSQPLALLVIAGLTPVEALRSTTLKPAQPSANHNFT